MHDSAVGGSYVNEGTLKVTTRVSDPVRVLQYIQIGCISYPPTTYIVI